MNNIHSFGKLALLVLALSASSQAFGQYNGWFDSASCGTISGWVESASAPNSPIYVDIYDGSSYVTSAYANIYRADVAAAGYGNGIHGFIINTPSNLLNGQSHTLSARPQGVSSNLPSSAQPITCSNGPHAYYGSLDGAGCASSGGWAWDANYPGTAVAVSLFADGAATPLATVLANTYRSDVQSAGFGTGAYGFTVTTPTSLAGGSHSVSIRPTSTSGETLYSSPRTIACTSAHDYRGWVDGADCNSIHGWAADLDFPYTTQKVTVFIDGQATTTTGTTTQSRTDVATALGVTGYSTYGFSITTPLALLDGLTHVVQVAIGDPPVSPVYFLSSSITLSVNCKGRSKNYAEGGCTGGYGVTISATPTFDGQTYSSNNVSGFYVTTPGDSLSTDVQAVVTNYQVEGSFTATLGYLSPVNNGFFSPLTDPAPAGNSLFSPGPSSTGWFQNLTFNPSGLDDASPNGVPTQGNYYFGGRATLNTCRGQLGPMGTVAFATHVTAAIQITSVSPTQLTAGAATQMTIQGSGFGRSGNVQFSGPSAFSVPYSGGTSTQINIQFNAPSTTGTYNVAIQEAVDYGGFSFGQQTGAAGQPPKSAQPQTVTVNSSGPRIYQDGTVDITGQTITVVVGQQINLSVKVGGVPASNPTWTLSGSLPTGGYKPVSPFNSASEEALPDLTQASIAFYWVTGSSNGAAKVQLSGSGPTATAFFNVVAPIGTMYATGASAVKADPPSGCTSNTVWCLHYGDRTDHPTGPNGTYVNGIEFDESYSAPSNFPGSFSWVQVVKSSVTARKTAQGAIQTAFCAGLDTTYPYNPIPPSGANDSPSAGLNPGYIERQRQDLFTMTLMFQPQIANSIAVPVASVDWGWWGDAVSNDLGSNWVLYNFEAAGPLSPGPTAVFPGWAANAAPCLRALASFGATQ